MTVEIKTGDALEVLRGMAAGSVHMVCTSPPYWGLRDYGVDGQIGLEQTPDAWCARLVEVFREVRRVLRDDGVIFVNVGDSYCSGIKARRTPTRLDGQKGPAGWSVPAGWSNRSSATRTPPSGDLKIKDLIGQPWMVAFALRADGWHLRSEIVWSKPNPMPEGVTDRPSKSHEQVFLLTKSGSPIFWQHRDLPGARSQPAPDYRWIHRETGEEVAEDPGDPERWRRVNLWSGRDYFYDAEAIREAHQEPWRSTGALESMGRKDVEAGVNNGFGLSDIKPRTYNPAGRNARTVWTIPNEPFSAAHFATFPSELARRTILAGTSAQGCCPACGAPWARVVERQFTPQEDVSGDLGVRGHADQKPQGNGWQDTPRGSTSSTTTGWRPTCDCDAGVPIPCTVLDPFGGAGTTGLAAKHLGRDAILIELNPEYAAMARQRIDAWHARRAIGAVDRPRHDDPDQLDLLA